MRYVAILDGRAGAYGVVFPDLPGCFSGGETVEEALANAQEAIVMWVEDMEGQGEDVPAPRPIEGILHEPKAAAAVKAGGAVVLVPLVRNSGRTARVNVSIDHGLLEAIDEAARVHKLTRSAFLTSAAREKISRQS